MMLLNWNPCQSFHRHTWIKHLLIFITICFKTTHGSKPSIVRHPSDGYGYQGAVISCKVDGYPKPTVTWLRNNTNLNTNLHDPNSKFFQTPDGLRISNIFNISDVGTYQCKAVNLDGVVLSETARLRLPVLGKRFNAYPDGVTTSEGKSVRLSCSPPAGQPQPTVTWLKDEVEVVPDYRVTYDASDLRIQNAVALDSGKYSCAARNHAGQERTPAVVLRILRKPSIVNATAVNCFGDEGSSVTLPCSLEGNSLGVNVTWLKGETNELIDMTSGRFLTSVDSYSLIIREATVEDKGLYFCEANNGLESVRAQRYVTVYTKPVFLTKPQSTVVSPGGTVVFRCEVDGSPEPEITWMKAGLPIMHMEQTYKQGRISFRSDGTLTISTVQKEDAGSYVCKAKNRVTEKGIVASATLEVSNYAVSTPVIIVGPKDIIALEKDTVSFDCQATGGSHGDEAPRISWERNNKFISERSDDRVTISHTGRLVIKRVKTADAGVYRCIAGSFNGMAEASARLTVKEYPRQPVTGRTIPQPPNQLFVTGKTSSEVTLAWYSADDRVNFTVFFFTHLVSTTNSKVGWRKAGASCSNIRVKHCSVQGLYPGTFYKFIAYAQNEMGTSEPSTPVEALTKGAQPANLQKLGTDLLYKKLNLLMVITFNRQGVTPTSFNVSWSMIDKDKKAMRYIEGYRVAAVAVNAPAYAPKEKRTVNDVVYGKNTNFHLVKNLIPDTSYSVALTPFFSLHLGRKSQAVQVRTLEDHPVRAPSGIQALRQHGRIDLKWTQVPTKYTNGQVRGHMVYIRSDNGKFSQNITANWSVDSYTIRGLHDQNAYRVAVSAFTSAGEGPVSNWVHSKPLLGNGGTDSDGQGGAPKPTADEKESVFFKAIIGVVGAVVWCLLCILIACFCLKRRASLKAAKKDNPDEISVPLHTTGSPPLYVTYQKHNGHPPTSAVARGRSMSHQSNGSGPLLPNGFTGNNVCHLTLSTHHTGASSQHSGSLGDTCPPPLPMYGPSGEERTVEMSRNSSQTKFDHPAMNESANSGYLHTYYDKTATTSSGPYATTYIFNPTLEPPPGTRGAVIRNHNIMHSSGSSTDNNHHRSTSSSADHGVEIGHHGDAPTLQHALVRPCDHHGHTTNSVMENSRGTPGGTRFADIAPPPPQHAPQQEVVQVVQCVKCGHCSDSSSTTTAGPSYSDGSGHGQRNRRQPSQQSHRRAHHDQSVYHGSDGSGSQVSYTQGGDNCPCAMDHSSHQQNFLPSSPCNYNPTHNSLQTAVDINNRQHPSALQRPSLPSSLIQGNRLFSTSSQRGTTCPNLPPSGNGRNNVMSPPGNGIHIMNSSANHQALGRPSGAGMPTCGVSQKQRTMAGPRDGVTQPDRPGVMHRENSFPMSSANANLYPGQVARPGLVAHHLNRGPQLDHLRHNSAYSQSHDGSHTGHTADCLCDGCQTGTYTEYDEPWSHPWENKAEPPQGELEAWENDDDDEDVDSDDVWEDDIIEDDPNPRFDEGLQMHVPNGDLNLCSSLSNPPVQAPIVNGTPGTEDQQSLLADTKCQGEVIHQHPMNREINNRQGRPKRRAKERRGRRPTSPSGGYSTDSSFVFVTPRKPYPKSERKKQMVNNNRRNKQDLATQMEQDEVIGLANA